MQKEGIHVKKGLALVNIFRYVYRFAEGKRKTLFLYIGMFTGVNIIDQLDIILIGYIFNYLQNNGISTSNINHILLLIGGFLLLDSLSWALHGPARILERKMAFFVSNNFRDYLYANTLELPLTFHSEEHSGQIISKINKGTTALYNFTEGGFLILKSIFAAIAILIALFVYDYRFALAAIVCLFFTYVIIYFFEKAINPLRDAINKSDNILSEIVYDTISNITTIKMLSLVKVVSSSLDKETARKFIPYKREIVLNEFKWYMPSLLGTLFIVGVLIYYVYSIYVIGAVIMIGTLYTLYGFLSRLKSVLFDVAWLMAEVQKNNRDIFNSEALSRNFTLIKKEHHKQLNNIEQVALRDLSFSYNDVFKLEVDSLLLEKGKSYAFVGESGCGKTTLLKLLASLAPADDYTLQVNGKPALFENLKDSAMLIPQEPELFSNTIRENITLGLPFSDKEISSVLRMTRMEEVINDLPEKIESKIFEKGVNLSGGQKQRLALARGMLFAQDKEIVLLDEPTSSVDQENEEKIYEEIINLSRDKILISSVHKRNLLHFFDYVVYFEKGKVREVVTNNQK